MLKKIIDDIYSGVITFEDSGARQQFCWDSENCASVKFLDLFVVCAQAQVKLLHYNPNELWIWGYGPRGKFHQRQYSIESCLRLRWSLVQ